MPASSDQTKEETIKRNVALVFLIVVCLSALALMPALASPLIRQAHPGDPQSLSVWGKDRFTDTTSLCWIRIHRQSGDLLPPPGRPAI